MKNGGYDYDQVLTTLMAQFYPAGMLGVGLTALMASFMSGMAGNVTAFNTVFTYDIYQSYIRPNAPDCALPDGGPPHHGRRRRALDRHGVPGAALQQHQGSAATGVRLRQCAAVRHVPAGHVLEAHHRPRRVHRPADAAPLAAAADPRADGGRGQGRLARRSVHEFPSTMAQNFWIAIFAWTTCFVVTILVSLVTRPTARVRASTDLVYGLTECPTMTAG